jgi:hypothetical protein
MASFYLLRKTAGKVKSGSYKLLSSEQKVEECDATEADSSKTAW